MQNLICNVLDTLERFIINIHVVRCFVLYTHEKALTNILGREILNPPEKVVVVGGGIYPRTAIIVKKLFPNAKIIIQDMSKESLSVAQNYLKTTKNEANIFYLNSKYDSKSDSEYHNIFDTRVSNNNDDTLIILPLAFRGNNIDESQYKIVKHCWLWERLWCSNFSIVSVFFLKKITISR